MTDGLWLKDPGTPPDIGWQYPAISGPNIKATAWSQLCGKVAQHYRTNGRAVPTCDEVTKWVCDNLPVACYEGRRPYANEFTNPPTLAKRGLPSPEWGVLEYMKKFAIEGDRGIGDIIARKVGPIGGDLFKHFFFKAFGKSCGCKERQEDWNISYPL